MIYLFQITVYAALLYSIYLLLLKNRAPHSFNRLYLLLCVSLPLAIPFIRIPAFYNSLPLHSDALNILLPEAIIIPGKNLVANNAYYRWTNTVIGIYELISVALLCQAIIQYVLFRRMIKRNKYEVINGAKVLLDIQAGPGSFLNYIFMPGKEINPAIFDHELAHIRLKHSGDILFIRLLQVIFWPNLMLYLVCRELKIVHEFQADAYAVKNKESYISTLLNNSFNTTQFALSHTFFYHPLKRRIMMLQQSPLSRHKARQIILKTVVTTAILLTGIIYLQSCKEKTPAPGPASNQSTAIVYDTIGATKAGITRQEEIHSTADIMPKAGYNLAEFIQENLKYPEEARKQQKEGRVIVKFVVDESGNIILPQILKSPDELLSNEALRVVKMMPAWTPGEQGGKKVPVYFFLPISFKLG